jgi:hypothetical protein
VNASDRAHAVIRIGTSLQARLTKDILDTTTDPEERNELLAGCIGMVLRRSVQGIPLPVDKHEWLAAIITMAVEP